MYLPSWQSLLMVATFPNIIVIIAGLCGCIPESIRWQVCEGKAQDVFETVVKIADFNKVKKFGVGILYFKVEKIEEDSLDSIPSPSPSVKI